MQRSGMSSSSSSAVFPLPPPLLVENLPPLMNQLSPVAAAAPASEQLCCVHCHFCDTVLVVSVPMSSLFKTVVTVWCGHCGTLLTVDMRGLILFLGTPTTNTAAPPVVTSCTTTTTTTIAPPPPPEPVSSVNNNNGQFNFPPSLNLPANPLHHHHSILLDEISSANNPISLQLLEQEQHALIHGACRNARPQQQQLPTTSAGKGAKQPSPRTNAGAVNRPPEKRQRGPSAYNRFIRDEIQRIKSDNPDISHREAFSTAAKNWAYFPDIHFGLMPDHHGLNKTSLLPQDQLRKDGLL